MNLPPNTPTKVCATCKEEFVLGWFPKASGNTDGHAIHCTNCLNEKKRAQPSYNKYNKKGGKKWQRMNFNNEPN